MGARWTWVHISAPLVHSCMALVNLLNHTEPLFPCWWNGNNNASLIRLLWDSYFLLITSLTEFRIKFQLFILGEVFSLWSGRCLPLWHHDLPLSSCPLWSEHSSIFPSSNMPNFFRFTRAFAPAVPSGWSACAPNFCMLCSQQNFFSST